MPKARVTPPNEGRKGPVLSPRTLESLRSSFAALAADLVGKPRERTADQKPEKVR